MINPTNEQHEELLENIQLAVVALKDACASFAEASQAFDDCSLEEPMYTFELEKISEDLLLEIDNYINKHGI